MMKSVRANIYRFGGFSGGYNSYLSRDYYADQIEVLKARAELLEGKDRAIMAMYLEGGNSVRQIARVAGVTESAISRRISKLMNRLRDSEFIFCLRNREHFNGLELGVAKDFFLAGISQSEIAESRKVSVYKVRQIVGKIRAFKKSISKVRRVNV